MSDDFDRWLERELPRALVRVSPPAHPHFLELRPARMGYRVRFTALRTRVGRAAMIGVSVAFIATAGISAESAPTGSPNPFFSGQGAAPNSLQCNALRAGGATNAGTCAVAAPPLTPGITTVMPAAFDPTQGTASSGGPTGPLVHWSREAAWPVEEADTGTIVLNMAKVTTAKIAPTLPSPRGVNLISTSLLTVQPLWPHRADKLLLNANRTALAVVRL